MPALPTAYPRGARNDPLVGAAWVVLATALMAGLAVFAKSANQAGVHPFEVVFLRNLFAALVFSPLLYVRGSSLLDPANLKLYGWRCFIGMLSMSAWFTALSMIPLGELTAISFLTPLFGTLAAVVFLGEIVRRRRWTALAVGFMGAMIILRPGYSDFGFGHMLAVASCITGGYSAILVKQLTGRDDPDKIVFLTHLILVPMSLIPAMFVWTWPPAHVLPLLFGMGVCATLGHVAMVRGFAATDASLVMTFEFAKLPFAAAVAWLVFDERVDFWTWVGAAIIFGSAAYIARREAQLRRERAAGYGKSD